MAHITFIHGIGNKPPRDVLLEQWRVALLDDAGIDLDALGVTSSMALWSDILYAEPAPAAAGNESSPLELQDAVTAQDADLSWLAAVPVEEQAFVAGLGLKIGLAEVAAASAADDSTPLVPGSALEALPLPGWLSRRLMRVFLRDVHHYLYDAQSCPRPGEVFRVRRDVRARALEALTEGADRPGPHVVVSHSLGTVIAYDVLTTSDDAPPVDALVTLGSPLGISEIQRALTPPWTAADGWPGRRMPEGLWVNLTDRLDPVCGPDPAIANEYRRRGEKRVRDVHVRNPGSWRHSVVKYLGHHVVRDAVGEALGVLRTRPVDPELQRTGTGDPTPTGSWTARLRDAVEDFDWPLVTAVVDEYRAHLRAAPAQVPVREAKEVLRLLRENRRYEELLAVADALLANHVIDAGVKRAVAQGLVDRGRPATSLLVFRAIADDPETTPAEAAEALGGIGRCCKELFLATTDPATRRGYLTRAYTAYRGAYDDDPDNGWLGINAAALLARAAREGLTIDDAQSAPVSPAAARSQARRLAGDVLDAVVGTAEPDVWALATACEASVALGDLDEAVGWAGQIVDGGDASAFELAALVRQLTTVWQLDAGTPPGDRLLPMLRAELLSRNGGDVVLDVGDLRADLLDPTSEESLEKIFGDTRFVGLPWYRTGLERCRAVARVETESADGIGTGFLVAGPALHPALPPLVLLTNGHVIPEGLDPQDAFVAFHGVDADGAPEPAGAGAAAGEPRFRVRRLLWHEPSAAPGLDTSILELAAYPPGVDPLPVADDLPRLGGRTSQRAYIIGHPRGLETPQYSLQDNVILDYDDVLLHYRSPTEPGSSGSPVFDNQWRLIGLHHAGRTDTPRLHNAGGTYAANEAILLAAVRRRLAERPPVEAAGLLPESPGEPTG
jgi:hypothetical protein